MEEGSVDDNDQARCLEVTAYKLDQRTWDIYKHFKFSARWENVVPPKEYLALSNFLSFAADGSITEVTEALLLFLHTPPHNQDPLLDAVRNLLRHYDMLELPAGYDSTAPEDAKAKATEQSTVEPADSEDCGATGLQVSDPATCASEHEVPAIEPDEQLATTTSNLE
jgi:hypothetical protein